MPVLPPSAYERYKLTVKEPVAEAEFNERPKVGGSNRVWNAEADTACNQQSAEKYFRSFESDWEKYRKAYAAACSSKSWRHPDYDAKPDGYDKLAGKLVRRSWIPYQNADGPDSATEDGDQRPKADAESDEDEVEVNDLEMRLLINVYVKVYVRLETIVVARREAERAAAAATRSAGDVDDDEQDDATPIKGDVRTSKKNVGVKQVRKQLERAAAAHPSGQLTEEELSSSFKNRGQDGRSSAPKAKSRSPKAAKLNDLGVAPRVGQPPAHDRVDATTMAEILQRLVARGKWSACVLNHIFIYLNSNNALPNGPKNATDAISNFVSKKDVYLSYILDLDRYSRILAPRGDRICTYRSFTTDGRSAHVIFDEWTIVQVDIKNKPVRAPPVPETQRWESSKSQ